MREKEWAMAQDQGMIDVMIDRVEELAVFPHVVFSLLEPPGPPDPTARELESIISSDPGFCAKVLVLANSGAFPRGDGVVSLGEAIRTLGYRTIRTLAMTAGTFEVFAGKNDDASLRRRRWWRHSLDAAHAARWLASGCDQVDQDEAYTCALLHLLGKSLLDRYGSFDYGSALSGKVSGQLDCESEFVAYGFDHIDLVVALADYWGLPERMVSALNYRCVPEIGDKTAPLRATVALGSRLASMAYMEPSLRDQEIEDSPRWAMYALKLSQRQLHDVLTGGLAAIAAGRARL
jgi:HD-like signal output (HDOD) protein